VNVDVAEDMNEDVATDVGENENISAKRNLSSCHQASIYIII